MIWTRLSQYGFPFHPLGVPFGNPVMHRLRVAGRSTLFATHPRWKRIPAKTAMTALWPFGAAMTAIRAGVYAKAAPARILDAWWVAMQHNVPPVEYFLHRLWNPARRARLDDYLYWTENGLSLSALNRAAGWQPEPCPVADKRLFFQLCHDLDLPTPEVFSVWRDGRQADENIIPPEDLWLKPARGQSGIGAERWNWRDGAYRRDTQTLTPVQMTAHIARHSRLHRETLVQAVIHAHDVHAHQIGDGPLCTRIVTGRRRNGVIEIIDAMAVWPRDGREVTQGGNLAMVDIASGHVGTVHEAPQGSTASQMEGQPLPDWSAALEAVRTGHSKLPQYVFLGWDVAFGSEGPVLLETNSGWGSFHFQILPDRPIADTPFAEIAAEYV